MGFGLFPTQRRYPIEKWTISRSRRSRFNYISKLRSCKKQIQTKLACLFFYSFHSSLKENTRRNKTYSTKKQHLQSAKDKKRQQFGSARRIGGGQTSSYKPFTTCHWTSDPWGPRIQKWKKRRWIYIYMCKVLSCHRDGHFDILEMHVCLQRFCRTISFLWKKCKTCRGTWSKSRCVFVHRDCMNWQTQAYTVYRCRLVSEVKHERRVTCKTILPLHPPAPESIPSEEIRV